MHRVLLSHENGVKNVEAYRIITEVMKWGLSMLWICDYVNIHTGSSDCVVVEADDYDSAYTKAIEELKSLKIPKRYLLKLEEF